MKNTAKFLTAAITMSLSSMALADNDNYDLDDIRGWKLVKMETCMDAALDTIPGNVRKLEMKTHTMLNVMPKKVLSPKLNVK